jgi:hypothetical protein
MDLFALRGLERLAAVVIGGMAIYLGYRLFQAIPAQGGEGEARISLPGDVSIMISRVGPGVFFALFGTLVVAGSLYFAIKHDETSRSTAEGLIRTRTLSGIGSPVGEATVRRRAVAVTEEVAADPQALDLDRLNLRRQIEFLNQSPRILSGGLSTAQRERAEQHLREIKLRLMQTVWSSDWGDPKEFRDWAEGGPEPRDPGAFGQARTFYSAGVEGAS